MYLTTLPVAEARAQLSRLIEAATTSHERFEITRDGYRAAVLLSPAAGALTERLPAKIAAAADEYITGPLVEDPRRVGKPLAPSLAPAWTARRGSYRILYNVDEGQRVVEVTAIRHRADAYRS